MRTLSYIVLASKEVLTEHREETPVIPRTSEFVSFGRKVYYVLSITHELNTDSIAIFLREWQ